MVVLGIITILIVCSVIVFMSISFYICMFGGGPFMPTPMPAVHKVLKAAKIKKGDKIVDIGAGDGRFIHFAEQDYGASATGFELDPFVFFLAKLRQWFWHWKGKMVRSNFQKHSLKNVDIVVCYMLPKTLAKFQKKFDKELRKGAKVVSYAFHIGSWKPKKIIPKEGRISKIFIYEK